MDNTTKKRSESTTQSTLCQQDCAQTKTFHYIIASYPGKKGSLCRDRLVDVYPHPELYLRKNLEHLLKIEHNITQITIMKAKPALGTSIWPNFYNVDDLLVQFKCPIEMVDCPNFGLSYGQYFEAYQRDRKLGREFDYYCFIEEDYTAASSNFDMKLIEMYSNAFDPEKNGNEIGYLCSWAPMYPKFHAAHEFGLINKKTMDHLYAHWNQNPANQLKNLVHGEVQLRYSDLFVLAGIQIKDFSKEYYTPFYNGAHKRLVNCSRSPRLNEAIFIPVQMVDQDLSISLQKVPLVKNG